MIVAATFREPSSVEFPDAMKNYGRSVYYSAFSCAARDVGLALNRLQYLHAVIEHPLPGLLKHVFTSPVVAMVESDSALARPDDFTDEYTKGGINVRKYDGLQIGVVRPEYYERISKIGDVMRILTQQCVKIRILPAAHGLMDHYPLL